jgi:hypothetical protein
VRYARSDRQRNLRVSDPVHYTLGVPGKIIEDKTKKQRIQEGEEELSD